MAVDSTTELFIDGEWVDVSAYVLARDGIAITRGRADGQSQVSPGSMRLTLDNSDHRFSNRLPSSPYFRKLGRNTPIRQSVAPAGVAAQSISDSFTRTAETSGWGSIATGQQWYRLATASSFSTTGTAGTVSFTGSGTSRTMVALGETFDDVDVVVSWSCSMPTGADLEPANLVLRMSERDTMILARVSVSTAGVLTLSCRARIFGAETVVDSTTKTDITYSGGTTLRTRAVVDGTRLRMRVWDPGGAEPSTWDLEVANCLLLTPGFTGVRCGAASGNTNSPATFTIDDYAATGNGQSRRFFGEVSSWAPRWDPSGQDNTVPVTAGGLFRRLTQGAKNLRSPIYREIMSTENDSYRVAYWPIEDGSEATQFGSATGATPGVISGSVSPAAYSGILGSDAIATLGTGGSAIFNVPTYTTTSTEIKVASTWNLPATASVATDTVLIRAELTGGTLSHCDVSYNPADNGCLKIGVYSGALVSQTAYLDFGIDGRDFYFTLELSQDGSDVDYTLYAQHAIVGSTYSGVSSGTAAGRTWGKVSRVLVAPNGGAAELSFSHVAVATDTGALPRLQTADGALVGHASETAGNRIIRLCAEENLGFEMHMHPDLTEEMGPQRSAPLLDLLQECAEADQGVMYESRHGLGVAYKPRVGLYNQTGPILDYDARHLIAPIDPAEDDQDIRNDVTVDRPDGSFARSVREDGALSILEPPDGVGVYDRGSATLNVFEDEQLDQAADWKVHLGTWDELRFPALSVNLDTDAWTDTDLLEKVTRVDTGNRIFVVNLPAWLPPDDLSLMIQGYDETIGTHSWVIRWNLTPGWAWEALLLDTGGSTLLADIDSDDAMLHVVTSLGPEWDEGYEPYHISIAGEAMTVTDMSSVGISYVGTGTASHADNTGVSPGLVAGVQPRDLNLIFAAIRNSGTGTVNVPTGWTSIVDFGNARLLGRYYETGDTAPLVQFTGGVSGASCSAQMVAFRSASMALGSGTKAIPAAATVLNASAANIAYPALTVVRDNCVVLYLGWKQDDWTSVAALAGATEAFEATTLLGSDQGLVIDYVIQTTGTNIASGSFTVTGGASAISRGITVALRPIQTCSVVRSVNGVTGSIESGEAITAWRPGVTAL